LENGKKEKEYGKLTRDVKGSEGGGTYAMRIIKVLSKKKKIRLKKLIRR